jgi:uncharacterized protein involved in exopolysaccharide biosynthesis
MLKALKADYATLTAKYGPSHPDVLKTRRQIAAMEKQTGDISASAALQTRLDDVQARLQAAQQTYGPQNPTVISLQNQVKTLETSLATEKEKAQSADAVKDADNPAYLQVVAQIRAAEEQYKGLLAEKQALVQQQRKYRAAIVQNPEVEQKLATLTRDYDNARLRYRELKAKKLSADMTRTLQQDRSGQRLIVINPPELPIGPSPSRFILLLLLVFLSPLVGLGAGLIDQNVKQTIVGPTGLEALLGAAPLVTLPHIETPQERRGLDKRNLKTAGLNALGIALLLMLVSLFVMPLNLLWAVVLRKLGLV